MGVGARNCDYYGNPGEFLVKPLLAAPGRRCRPGNCKAGAGSGRFPAPVRWTSNRPPLRINAWPLECWHAHADADGFVSFYALTAVVAAVQPVSRSQVRVSGGPTDATRQITDGIIGSASLGFRTDETSALALDRRHLDGPGNPMADRLGDHGGRATHRLAVRIEQCGRQRYCVARPGSQLPRTCQSGNAAVPATGPA